MFCLPSGRFKNNYLWIPALLYIKERLLRSLLLWSTQNCSNATKWIEKTKFFS